MTKSESFIGNRNAQKLWFKIAFILILTGIGAGMTGMLLAMLLRVIQHVAYGYGFDDTMESFLLGATNASDRRRILVLAACGSVAGIGWWAVHRFGKPIVSVKKAIVLDAPEMPFGSTLVHALLQIVTVGMGSPLGREVAPREVGALIASEICKRADIAPSMRQVIIACGAGAGLAAVYNVPIGGAVFVLEVLLITFSWHVALMALTASVIGAGIAWIGLGAQEQYTIPHFSLSTNLIVFAILCGPLFGVAGYGFVRLTGRARANAVRGMKLVLFCFVNFAFIGCLAVWIPQILGNGKGPAELGFEGEVGLGVAAVLLVAKVFITTTTLRSGAEGGLLTPSLAIGALLATLIGYGWNSLWPGAPLGAIAIIGATAFLASSMSMPLSAIILVAEFTRIDHDFLVPVMLAVAGSVGASRLCTAKFQALH
ncbi:chloride channel protein [Pseudomonas sp. PP3]|uniref:chloride channel protein n=1 Tax=Pseudomonas sp. PP3 TaxID=2815936 RepID=UPI001BAE60DE|nr:chloride channel protein [Pseudomonas sp. PP3]